VRNGSSNQYVKRSKPRELLATPTNPLMSAQAGAGPPAQCRCQQIWGGGCQVRVGPPAWAHGKHPKDLDTVRAAARNPDCPPAVLEHLSGYPDFLVQLGVAGNRSCAPEVREQLSYSSDFEVRIAAVSDPDDRCS